MNRSNYSDDLGSEWRLIMWRGAVTSAIKGRRGQKFLRELAAALDAMPEKKLITGKLQADGEYCALGCIAAARELDIEALEFPDDEYDMDYEHHERVAAALDIADALAREVMWVNDHGIWGSIPDREKARWRQVRNWVEENLREES